MDFPGPGAFGGLLGILGRLDPGELQQMVVDGPLLAIEQDFLGAHDLAKLSPGLGVARVEIGMSPFHRLTKGRPQGFGVVAR